MKLKKFAGTRTNRKNPLQKTKKKNTKKRVPDSRSNRRKTRNTQTIKENKLEKCFSASYLSSERVKLFTQEYTVV